MPGMGVCKGPTQPILAPLLSSSQMRFASELSGKFDSNSIERSASESMEETAGCCKFLGKASQNSLGAGVL